MSGQRRGPVGRGYMPKGGVSAAREHNAQVLPRDAGLGSSAGAAAPPAPVLSDVTARSAARSRGGRAVTPEGLVLVAVVASVAGLVSDLCIVLLVR